MTTLFKNIDYTPEILSFKLGKKVAPLRLIHAMADLSLADPHFFKSDEGAALTHSFLVSLYGPNYQLDGKKKQAELFAKFD